jgi:hypothetical protein
VAVQVDEQLTVRELLRQPMGGVHRQRGLADPGHAVDRRDHHRAAGRVGLLQQAGQPVQLGTSA